MLKFARIYKQGFCKIPEALQLLDLVRKDIVESKKEEYDLNEAI